MDPCIDPRVGELPPPKSSAGRWVRAFCGPMAWFGAPFLEPYGPFLKPYGPVLRLWAAAAGSEESRGPDGALGASKVGPFKRAFILYVTR